MKYSTFLVGALFLLVNCSDVSGVSEPLSPEELIVGSWQVSNASIDGQIYPVTNPGFGQIQAIFDESNVTYIFPGVDANGLPTAQTDTLRGDWNFNGDYSKLFITNIPNELVSEMEWGIMNIGVGLLQTTYVGPSPLNQSVTANYEITYRLTQ